VLPKKHNFDGVDTLCVGISRKITGWGHAVAVGTRKSPLMWGKRDAATLHLHHNPQTQQHMSTATIAAPPKMGSSPAPAPLSQPVVFATSGLGGMLGWVLVHVSEVEK